MVLTEHDADLFYELFLPLLNYVNRTYRISGRLKTIARGKRMDQLELHAVAVFLWDNPNIIDEYLRMHNNLPDEHTELIRSWKRHVTGRFILERNLKAGSIFISMDNSQVYQVSGIIDSFEEMFSFQPLPIILSATLIPFRDVIITDGLIMTYSVHLGGGIRKMLKETYMAAKKNGNIHRTL